MTLERMMRIAACIIVVGSAASYVIAEISSAKSDAELSKTLNECTNECKKAITE